MEQLRQTVQDKDNDPRDAIQQLEQKLNQLTITLHPPSELNEEVLDKYTNTLCTTQKKTSLESSLLQDIPTSNGQDSSQLEDWLTDIETASELMGKSRTKLAQAKLRGLVRMLILETLSLQKTWEDIKDSLCLKIFNSAFTHPLAALWTFNKQKKNPWQHVFIDLNEANRCKFDDDAATIRIFLKGLKMHIL